MQQQLHLMAGGGNTGFTHTLSPHTLQQLRGATATQPQQQADAQTLAMWNQANGSTHARHPYTAVQYANVATIDDSSLTAGTDGLLLQQQQQLQQLQLQQQHLQQQQLQQQQQQLQQQHMQQLQQQQQLMNGWNSGGLPSNNSSGTSAAVAAAMAQAQAQAQAHVSKQHMLVGGHGSSTDAFWGSTGGGMAGNTHMQRAHNVKQGPMLTMMPQQQQQQVQQQQQPQQQRGSNGSSSSSNVNIQQLIDGYTTSSWQLLAVVQASKLAVRQQVQQELMLLLSLINIYSGLVKGMITATGAVQELNLLSAAARRHLTAYTIVSQPTAIAMQLLAYLTPSVLQQPAGHGTAGALAEYLSVAL